MKTCLILGLIIALMIMPFSTAAVRHWKGGSYTGVMPNCTSSDVLINAATVWQNMEVNLSHCSILDQHNFRLKNVTVRLISTDNNPEGINVTETYKNQKFWYNDSRIIGVGNASYIYVPFNGSQDYAATDNLDIRIRNTRFENFGQASGWTDDANKKEGFKIHECNNHTSYMYNVSFTGWQGLYFALGASGNSACKINLTKLNFTDVLYTAYEQNDGVNKSVVIDQMYCNGVYNKSYTNSNRLSYCVQTSNSKGLIIKNSYFANCYYSLDYIGGDKDGIVYNNDFYNVRAGPYWNTNSQRFYVSNNRVHSVIGKAADAVGLNTNVTNFTINNNYLANSRYCLILANAGKTATHKGNGAHDIVLNGNTCLNSTYCWNIQNASNVSMSYNNCTDAATYGLYAWKPAFNLQMQSNKYARIGNWTMFISNATGMGAQVNGSASGDYYYDWYLQSQSRDFKFDRNFWGNDTTPDTDYNGYVDHPHLIPGGLHWYDLHPLAIANAAKNYMNAHVLAICNQTLNIYAIAGLIVIVFIGVAMLIVLTSGGASFWALVISAVTGIIALVIGLVVVTSIC